MHSRKHCIGQIAYRVAILLMGAQILLGVLWLCGNFVSGQDFAESAEWLEISRSWVLDEYVGIVYPALLSIMRQTEILTGIPYQRFLYLLQLLMNFGAAIYFLDKSGLVRRRGEETSRWWRRLCGNWKLYFGAAYICTIPMITQLSLAVTPDSLGMAIFLAVLGESIFLLKSKELAGKELGKSVAVMAGGWLVGALLLPEYIVLMAVPVFLGFVGYMWRNRKVCPALLIAFAAVLLVYAGAAGAYQEPGSRGRIRQSADATLLRRVVWPNFDRNAYFWSDEVKALFTVDELRAVSNEPENVVYVFGPGMEAAYGEEAAKEQYRSMVKTSWEMRTKDIVLEIAQDEAAYLCPPVAVLLQLRGLGVSYSGFHYDVLCANTPVLAQCYAEVSLIGFALLALATMVKLIYGIIVKKERPSGPVSALWVCTCLGISFWYTMEGAGMWDYRNVPVICALWGAAVTRVLVVTQTEMQQEMKRVQSRRKAVLVGALGALLAVYFCICGYQEYIDYQTIRENKGTTIVCFGDSIWDVCRDETGIAGLVESRLEAEIINLSISGTSATKRAEHLDSAEMWNSLSFAGMVEAITEGRRDEWLDAQNERTGLYDVDYGEVDYFLIAYGLNDYFCGFARETEDVLDEYTYAGALRTGIEKLQKAYPNAKIMILSPTYCQLYSYGKVIADSDDLDYGGGLGTDYVKSAKKVAAEYQLGFSDNYDAMHINVWNGTKYLRDATHFTREGRRVYARIVTEALLEEFRRQENNR